MFSTIVVATDLSAESHAVVACAARLRVLGTAECVLLQCLNSQDTAAPDRAPEQTMLEQKAVLEASGLRVRIVIASGLPHVDLDRIAREQRTSLIVVGAENPHCGICATLLHQSSTPIILVRGGQTATDDAGCSHKAPFDFTEHILFPTDFSMHAHQAFPAVKHMAACGAKAITLFHVQDKGRIDPHLMGRLGEFDAVDRQRLENLRNELTSAGANKVDMVIRFGHPGREILREIESRTSTLVVMGSQGRGFFGEAFLGSVSHYVARRSSAPVLLIPALQGG